MGILRLGKPNSKIAEEIRRRREQPEKKLKMTGTNGTVCEFSYSDTTSALVFDDRKAASVLYPYSLCSDIDSPDKLVSVCDEGNRITAIGDGTGAGLYDCGKLSSVCCPKLKIIRNTAMRKLFQVKSYDFPELETIENSGISYNRFLSSLNAPNIRYVADAALADNEMLSAFSVSPANPNFSLVDEFNNVGKSGIVLIDENLHNAVWGSIPMCKDVLLPNSVSGIGSQSFMNCKKLERIECDRVTLIEDKAFYGCISLSTVVLSNMSNDDLTQLGGTNAFGVKRAWPVSVYVPLSCVDGLYSNETWAGLNELSIIKIVGAGGAAEKLKMTSISGTAYEFNYTDFSQPLKYVDAHQKVLAPWTDYPELSDFNMVAQVEDDGNQLTSIGYAAFYGCTNLTTFDMKNVISVDTYSFSNCTGLSSIDCGNIGSVPKSAFGGCTGLTSLDFGIAAEFGEKAVSQCTSLLSVACPKAQTLGLRSFFNCENLMFIDCPDAVQLCSEVFRGCKNLRTVILSGMSGGRLTDLADTSVFGSGRDYPISVYVPTACIAGIMEKTDTWGSLVENNTIMLIGVPET